MRAASSAALAVVVAVALGSASPVEAVHQKAKKHSGIKGVVLDSTCYGACAEPAPPAPVYTGGGLTVAVTRVADGAVVRTQQPADGHFRFRIRRGVYDVTAILPGPAPCPPNSVCPAGSAAVVMPSETGETKRLRVRRHRFAYVELHVRNACIV